MGTLEQLKRILAERGVPFVEDSFGLTVKAATPSGFDVTLQEGGDETTVYFAGWHDHFTEADAALRCFMAGLSPDCRIRVTERGGRPQKWVLERRQGDQWVRSGTTVLLFFQFWRPGKVRYLQNGA